MSMKVGSEQGGKRIFAALFTVLFLLASGCGRKEAPPEQVAKGTPEAPQGAESAAGEGAAPAQPTVQGTQPAAASPEATRPGAQGEAVPPAPEGAPTGEGAAAVPEASPEAERARTTKQLASKHAPAPGEPVVAWTEGRKVYRQDFESYVARLPTYQRRELASLEKKREMVFNYIRFDTLADLARKEGLDKDPDVLLAARTEMVKKYIQKKFGEDATADVSDEEIEAQYDRDSLMYNKPERVRVSHILFAKPKLARAHAVLGELRAALASPDTSTRQVFREFVRKYSEDAATNQRGGDLLFFSREGQVDGSEVRVDPGVVAAAFAMQNTDQVSEVVEGKDGFHILLLMNRREKVEKPLESVREDIRQNIAREKLDRSRREFMDKLVDFATWQVEVVELNKVTVEDVPPSPSAVKERVDSIKEKGKEESAPGKGE